MKKRLLILFSGTGTNADNIADYFKDSDVEIIHTITNNKNAKGIDVSKKHNIECTILDSKSMSKDEYDTKLIELLQRLEYDLVVLAGYMKILPLDIINSAKSKIVNIHPSLLPRHKGLHAIERSFEDEHEDAGITVHYVNEKVDDGEIILQSSFKKDGLDFDQFVSNIKSCEYDTFPKAIKIALGI
jgi:phosphoribosylglycinamide formyltransferase-1